MACSNHSRQLFPGMALAGAGLSLLVLSTAGAFPVLNVLIKAGIVEREGPLALGLAASQWWTAWALLASAIVYFFLHATEAGKRLSDSAARGVFHKLWVIALISGCASVLVQSLLFQGIPHITDATSHVFQAKILAGGHLAAPNPPCYEAFFQHNVVIGRSGLWHTKYFPGQALWLTPGFLMHAGWLMMPLGWALSVFSLGRLLRHHVTESEVILITAIYGLSPLGLLLSGSYMSHSTFLLFMIGGLTFFMNGLSSRAHGSAGKLLAAGILFGMAAITRPQDGFPFLCGLLIAAVPNINILPRILFRAALPVTAGMAIPLAFLLLWNHSLYGSLLTSGYNFEHSPSLTPIISDSIGFGPDHTPARAMMHAALTIFHFENAMTGWPVTLPLAAWILLTRRRRLIDLTCLGICGGTVFMYLFFHYWGFELEARYYAPMLPAAAVLLGRSLLEIHHRRSIRYSRDMLVPAVLAGFTVFTIGYTWAVKLWPVYSSDYEQASVTPMKNAMQLDPVRDEKKVLILMKSSPQRDFVYSGGFAFNDPDLRNQIIFARYIPKQLDCLREAFPDRVLYEMEPESFRIRELPPPD